MEDAAKINLKVGQIEISIEGPSNFVSMQYDKVEAHLKTYLEISAKISVDVVDVDSFDEENPDPQIKTNNSNSSSLPVSFGEWLNNIAKGTSDTSKAILAGYFTQLSSSSKNFRARDVSKLLKEHGIKLSNPSTFLKAAVNSKKIFQVSKTGSEAHYKLSREAEDEMKQLIADK